MLLACSKKSPEALPEQPRAAVEGPVVDAAIDAPSTIDAGATTYRVRPARGGWLPGIARAKGFESFVLPAPGTVHLTWLVGSTRRVRALPADQDYGANYVAAIGLRVERGGVVRTLDFGEEAGAIQPLEISFCQRSGWVPIGGRAWDLPKIDGVVSSFAVGVMQGNDEHLVMRGPNALYVLHRQTSDGRCDEGKQGPLDVCLGFEWQLRAVAELAGDPDFDESVASVDRFDCAVPSIDGSPLLTR